MSPFRKVALFFLGLDLKTADLLMQRLDRQVAHAVRREMLAIQDASPQEMQNAAHEFLQQVNSSQVYQGKIPAAAFTSADSKIDVPNGSGIYARPQPKQKIVGQLDTLEFSAAPHIVTSHLATSENTNSLAQKNSTAKNSVNDPHQLFDFLQSVSAATIAELLAHENTQTLVVVLAHLETATARDILAMFPQARQVELMRRLSQWEETDDEVIRMIAEMMRERISKMQQLQTVTPRGLSSARQLLATLDTHTRNHILEAIDRPTSTISPTTNNTPTPILAELASIKDTELAAVIRKVEPCVVMVAIAGSDNSLIARVLKNFSPREQRDIEEQLAHFLPIDPRDVCEAQLVVGRALKTTTRQTSTNAVYA